jgi:hypothetical protein
METKSFVKKFQRYTHVSSKENLGGAQRMVSIISGAYILSNTVNTKKKKKMIPMLWNAISGGYLIYRGLTGHCLLKDAFNKPQHNFITYLHKN